MSDGGSISVNIDRMDTSKKYSISDGHLRLKDLPAREMAIPCTVRVYIVTLVRHWSVQENN